jgi:transcriptional regulator with PAS, ATPase and Fis domain
VRLLFGTNVNIEESINQGMFQQDLYERIAKYVIKLPALRERPEDIPLLASKIIENLNTVNEFKLDLSEQAKELFQSYYWPGNIRQLQFYLEKLFNYCRYNKVSYVTDQHIKNDPPRDTVFNIKNPYVDLESVLKRILQNSENDHSKIVEDIIQPMLAKIYIDDLNGIRKVSSKYIGIDGTRGEKSTLTKRYQQYQVIKNELFK